MHTILQRIIVAVTFMLLIPLCAWADTSTGTLRISFVEGDVMLSSAETGEWVPASINTPLQEGDSLWCPDNARTELQLPNGTLVRLDHLSLVQLLNGDSVFTQLHLSQGRMFVSSSTSPEQNLQIDADDTTVLPFTRTRLRIEMKAKSEEVVSILKGAAYVEGNGNRTKVRAGEQVALEEGRTELLPLDPPDEWEQWNSERDRLFKRAYAADKYLPNELKPYAPDFDTNGTWVRTDEYGMVWRPITVDSDWAPYREGRWAWLRGEYVWISYENWGWAPHHYGRWIVVPSYGWCWVPPVSGDIYWSPGYVGWFSFGGSVGWVPLSPGEIYYGRGRFGRYSVNITTTNSRTISVRNDYKNSRSGRNGVTIVSQGDFLKGKIRPHGTPRNFVPPATAVIVGQPNLKPERETRMPVNRPVRFSAPAPNRALPVPEVKQRFPRVVPQARQNSTPIPTSTEQGTRPHSPSTRTVQPQHERPAIPTGSGMTLPAVQPPSVVRKPATPPQANPQAAPQTVVPKPRNVWRVNSKEGRQEKPEQKQEKQEQPSQKREHEGHR